jgi:hypothetical protein
LGQNNLLQRSGKQEPCEECQRKSTVLNHRSTNRLFAPQTATPHPTISDLPVLLQDVLQAKLTIGQPGDKYEQEADRVAEQVMRMPEPTALVGWSPIASGEPPTIQRVCSECRRAAQHPAVEEDEEERLRAKPIAGQRPTLAPTTHPSLSVLQGSGQPLPPSERAFFEPRFGIDFSQVRIHTDSRAAEMAHLVNARAFTIGREIVFHNRLESLTTPKRRLLLAHELVHVIQQNRKLSVGSHFRVQPSGIRPLSVKQRTSQFILMRITPSETRDAIDDMVRYYERILSFVRGPTLTGTGSNLATIRVLDSNNRVRIIGRGAYLPAGSSLPEYIAHAEERAAANIRARLRSSLPSAAPGGRMIVVTTQTPCGQYCQGVIANLASEMGINPNRVEVFQITRSGQNVHGITALHNRGSGLRLAPISFRVGGAQRWDAYQRIGRHINRFLRSPRYQAMLTRMPVYLATISSLANLFSGVSTGSHMLRLYSDGTIFPDVQRSANRLVGSASNDSNDAESLFEESELMSPAFLIALGEMIVSRETESLTAISASLGQISAQVDNLSATRRRALQNFQERRNRTRTISQQLLTAAQDLSQSPSSGVATLGATDALSAQYITLSQSYSTLSGTFQTICNHLQEALGFLEPMGQYIEGLRSTVTDEIERQRLEQTRERVHQTLERLFRRQHTAQSSSTEGAQPSTPSSSLPTLVIPPQESLRMRGEQLPWSNVPRTVIVRED